jgi:nicotinate-nucleotide pyrophosphorylase (carboxylating)
MLNSPLVKKLIGLALEEDLALGDITARLTVPEDHRSTAKIIARQRLIVCGTPLAQMIATEAGWNLDIEVVATEGEWLGEGSPVMQVRGRTADLLSFERTILNFLQRMSGVATYTRNFCDGRPAVHVLDTRKTMPGWRVLDKHATRVGGARNHRFSLGDMILVKNNHIDAHPDGIRGALSDIVSQKPLYMPWEVEVRTLEELSIALEYRPTIVMLDNFSDDQLAPAVSLVRACQPSPLIEASGGISKERLARIAAAGVDAVSVGALTTQAPNVDISMRISTLIHV